MKKIYKFLHLCSLSTESFSAIWPSHYKFLKDEFLIKNMCLCFVCKSTCEVNQVIQLYERPTHNWITVKVCLQTERLRSCQYMVPDN